MFFVRNITFKQIQRNAEGEKEANFSDTIEIRVSDDLLNPSHRSRSATELGIVLVYCVLK